MCRTKAVAAAHGLLLGVVEVGAGQEVEKDQLRHVAAVLGMHHDRDALPVVVDGNDTGLGVDVHAKLVHALGVALLVVGGVDENLREGA
jgi:hypothetical protein